MEEKCKYCNEKHWELHCEDWCQPCKDEWYQETIAPIMMSMFDRVEDQVEEKCKYCNETQCGCEKHIAVLNKAVLNAAYYAVPRMRCECVGRPVQVMCEKHILKHALIDYEAAIQEYKEPHGNV